ncbi:MAG TPA: hypothetical protein VIG99_25700 [Myxococcaceae bacterium]|jgi:hypothetical protein
MKRRMPGGANPIESVARAREHLAQLRPPAQVNALHASVWMMMLLRPGFGHFREAVEWLSETRQALQRIRKAPPWLTKLLADPSWKPAPPKARPSFAAMKLALAIDHAKALAAEARPFLDLFETQNFRRGLSRISRLPLEEGIAEFAFTYAQARKVPPFGATELMVTAVATGMEPPDEDHRRRLNTWAKRVRKIKRQFENQPPIDFGPVFTEITFQAMEAFDPAKVYSSLRLSRSGLTLQ